MYHYSNFVIFVSAQKYLIGLFHVIEVKNIGYGFVLCDVCLPTAT